MMQRTDHWPPFIRGGQNGTKPGAELSIEPPTLTSPNIVPRGAFWFLNPSEA